MEEWGSGGRSGRGSKEKGRGRGPIGWSEVGQWVAVSVLWHEKEEEDQAEEQESKDAKHDEEVEGNMREEQQQGGRRGAGNRNR